MLALNTTPAQIVAALGGELRTSAQGAQVTITHIAPLEQAQIHHISFLGHAKYARHLDTTQAGCVILTAELLGRAQAARPELACIVSPDPYGYYARLSQWWAQQATAAQQGWIHPSAVLDPSARVHASARIGALCVLGAGASVGAHTELRARVTVEADCHIGERCLIHSGVVIGADGFGFAPTIDRRWEKIAQLGGVRIGNDVEIGANTCIDRGALTDTVIEDGVKLDNLVQIGHNVRVGAHSALAGCAGVAGSATIGRHCTIGGGAVVLGHLSLADGVHISASTTVMRSIAVPGLYSGVFPIDANADWERNAVALRRLSDLRARVKQIERQMPANEVQINQVQTNQAAGAPATDTE